MQWATAIGKLPMNLSEITVNANNVCSFVRRV
jgi:hypothetical protein